MPGRHRETKYQVNEAAGVPGTHRVEQALVSVVSTSYLLGVSTLFQSFAAGSAPWAASLVGIIEGCRHGLR
jgi:hypothetical protein